MKTRCCLLLVVGMVSATPPAFGCLWDYDTLAMERKRFPGALELIAGKFLRHSPAFYAWRIRDREARLAAGEVSPNLYDDLAVAYEKLGNHQQAIEIILQKDQKFPGLYETHANLGTFYLHAGAWERGIQEIERAIAINPDAHFGREIYQKLLVEYVLSRQVDGKVRLPLWREDSPGSFAGYVLEQSGVSDNDGYDKQQVEVQKALHGVLGMMRFGNHDSPILLEALAHLLLWGSEDGFNEDAKRLAACAYLKASYECEDEETRQAYREMASRALAMQTRRRFSQEQLTLKELEEVFLGQLAEAKAWYAELEADEKAWIATGKNPEEEFRRKYDEEPSLSAPLDLESIIVAVVPALLIALALAAVLLVVLFVRALLRERATRRRVAEHAH